MPQATLDEGKRFSSLSVGALAFIVMSVIVIIHHFVFLSDVVTNIPTWDDFDLVLRFLNNYATSDNLFEKIGLILKRHNEHRIAETRILSLLQWKSMGEVDFKVLTIIGNCQLIFLLAILAFYYKKRGHAWYGLLSLPFIIFNLNSSGNMINTTNSVSNFAVLLFALLGIMILHYKPFESSGFRFRFWLSIVISLLATISGGTGFLTLFVCAFSLWVNRAPKAYSISWTVIMVAILIVHFTDQETSSHLQVLLKSSSDIMIVVSRFIIMTGNYFIIYGTPAYYVVLLMGSVMILGFTAYLLLKKPWVTNPTLFCNMIFLFGSSAIIALGRMSEGEMQAFANRYVIYSTLITAFLFALLLESVSKEKLKYIAAAFLLLNLFLFFQAYAENTTLSRSIREKLETGARSYHEQWATTLSYPDQFVALAVIEKSQSLGIYSLPGGLNPLYLAELVTPGFESTLSGGIRLSIEDFHEEEEFCVIRGWAYIQESTSSPASMDIILISQHRAYKKTCTVFSRGDVQEYFKEGPKNSGFRAVIFGDEIEEGTYNIAFAIDHSGRRYLDYSGRSITIKK